MKYIVTLALALAIVGSAQAQSITAGQTVVSGSESNSNANSGSVSGSTSASDQRQDQGQTQGLQNSNANTAQQGNQQATNLTFEASTIPTSTTVNWKGNTTVALAAGVSFSTDYCGGTASAGASAAGVSIGGAKPIMDGNCQAMRRAEGFGKAGANWYNAGQPELAAKLFAMQTWELCNAGNTSVQSNTAEACKLLGLTVPDAAMVHQPVAHVSQPQPPQRVAPTKQEQAVSKVRIKGSNGVEAEYEVGPDGRLVSPR